MARRTKQEEYRVFLSHSHQDQWLSGAIKEKIEACGIRVWLDAFDIPGGADIEERILQGLEACHECLVLLSPASVDSQWVFFEMAVARGLKKWMSPIVFHVPLEQLPIFVRSSRVLNLNDMELYFGQLVERGAKTREHR